METQKLDWPIIVTGACGLLGSAIVPLLQSLAPRPGALLPTDIAQPDTGKFFGTAAEFHTLDVTDESAIKDFVAKRRPAVVVNLAAYTDVDGCEDNRKHAIALNAVSPGIVARAAADVGALVVHITTDFVFDGAKTTPYVEDDSARPLCFYGESKLTGEQAVVSATENHLIVRTAWLYGTGGRNFVDTICRLAGERGEVQVVSDQIGCPTWTRDLAGAVISLLGKAARGTYHASGRGEATWYDLAVAAVQMRRVDATVRPISTAEMNRAARRPAYSVMSCQKLLRDTGFVFPPWRHSLRQYIAESP